MEPVATTRKHLAILFATWFLLYASFTLFAPPLMDDADSVHAEVAREMLQRNDWVTLYANGIRYLEKAPVLYWSMAASMKIFGPKDWAARLPLALGILALLLGMYRFGRDAFSESAGFYAAMILATSVGCFVYTRFLIPDILVCLWVALSLYCFWTTEQNDEQTGLKSTFFALFCALNVLTKGLIGVIFPLGIVFIYFLLTRGFRGAWIRIRQLQPALGLLVFFAVAAPWHILAGLHNPTQGSIAGIGFAHWPWTVPVPTQGNVHGWFWFYFLNEHLLRYLNLRVPRDYDTVPLALFWGLLLVWLMPWSAYLVSALRTLKMRATEPEQRTRLLLVLWAAAVMLFFSFSTRQEYYALPALPPLALLLAKWLSEEESNEAQQRTGRRIALLFLVVGSAVLLVALVCAFASNPSAPGGDLAAVLAQNPSDYALSLGHLLDLNANAMHFFRTPLLLTGFAFFLGGYGNWHARKKDNPARGNAFLFGMMIVFLIAVQMAFTTFNSVLGSKTLADAIASQLRPQDLLMIHGEYESGSSLGFYLRRSDIHIVDGRSSNLWYGSFFPDAPPIFEDAASLQQKWTGPQRIFMWNDPSDKQRPLPQLGSVYVLAKSGGKEMLSNQPNR